MWCTVLHPGYNYPGWFVSYFWVFPGVCSFRLKLQACKPPPASLYHSWASPLLSADHLPSAMPNTNRIVHRIVAKAGVEVDLLAFIYMHLVHGWKRNLTNPSLALCLSLALLVCKNLPLLPRKKFHWRWKVQMKKRCILKTKISRKNFVNISLCFFAWRV